MSSLPSVRKCGRVARVEGGRVNFRSSEGRVGLAGLCTCGSPWSCPVCNAKIAMVRRLEIAGVLASALAEGYSAAFVTLTMRHHRGQDLGLLWSALSDGWDRTTSGSARPWARDCARFGIAGWVRVVEVTESCENGWHVHVHVLVIIAGSSTQLDVDELGRSMFGRWSPALQSHGLDAPLPIGQAFRLVKGANAAEALSEYFAKLSGGLDDVDRLGLELTSTQSKTARSSHSTRSTWELLDEFLLNGDALALRRWHEFERTSYRKRQMNWSRNDLDLRKRFAMPAERSDDEIAAEELGSSADDVAVVEPAGWARLVRHPSWIIEALSALETSGPGGLHYVLTARQVDHFMVGLS